ncbi:glycoside hydrolase family 10 protein [Chitinimonas taiwanensis]|uniref:glycoside hydrolase family 10 protein n=1 Tax=Chitinimonas taiwanensis TaxID=240412 RepID=UPI0035B2DBA2
MVVSRRRLLASALGLAFAELAGCATPPTQLSGSTPVAAPPPTSSTTPSHGPVPQPVPSLPALPQPRQEFRAAWVATVANLDWPSKPGLSMAQQQTELCAILDRAVQLGLNAIVLQVRPSADALYRSELEPWSAYLTGKQGQPTPGAPADYDPLALWIAEAHARGLELHAWFNPYRAWHRRISYPLSEQHVLRSQPSWVREYGDYYWMDPGEAGAAERALAVMADVLRRYDIDGIQIDDYFYPYPIPAPGKAGKRGTLLDFPDGASWQRYQAGGGRLSRADWRRDNVNRLVAATHALVRAEKPWVKFGISPFGIGRPELRPAGIVGFSQYDQLYADAEHWLAQGWVDYLAPQLYWPVGQPRQAFAVLLASWQRANPLGRHVWPGLNTARVEAGEWSAMEIGRQIASSRASVGQSGQLHFSMRTLMQGARGLEEQLRHSYAQPALLPSYPWLGQNRPPAAQLVQDGGQLQVRAGPEAARLALWTLQAEGWQLTLYGGTQLSMPLPGQAKGAAAQALAVQVQNRLGQLSEPVYWQPQAAASTTVAHQ